MDWTEVSGKILSIEGFKQGSERVTITTDKGALVFDADVQCCDITYLADLEGDPQDLIGAELCVAKHLKSEDGTSEKDQDLGAAYHFYEIQTHKGDLWMRWYGDSGETGCYSNEVKVSWTPYVSLTVSQTLSVPPKSPLVSGLVKAAQSASSVDESFLYATDFLRSRGILNCSIDEWRVKGQVTLVAHVDAMEQVMSDFYSKLYA